MFTIGIRYLNGWSMSASDGAEKKRAEWPPHPDRVFMALASAWFETGEVEQEGDALRWLEKIAPPDISFPGYNERRSVRSFVPTNDSMSSKGKGNKAVPSFLPEHRLRKPRRFPAVVPHMDEDCLPEVYLTWRDADIGINGAALKSLTGKVTHIGHSASLVQVWVESDTAGSEKLIRHNLAPVKGISKYRLRVPYEGRLKELRQSMNLEQYISYMDLDAQVKNSKGAEKKRFLEKRHNNFGETVPVTRRPSQGRWQFYDALKQDLQDGVGVPPQSVFRSQLIVMRLVGARISLPATLKVTEAVRGLLLRKYPRQTLPEWLSGHDHLGRPSVSPHLAIVPLSFVGNQHADGRIMGIGLVIPKSLPASDFANSEYEIDKVLSAFIYSKDYGDPIQHNLFNGKCIECVLELEDRETPPLALHSDRWTQTSRVWASVTPVVLNRHFKGSDPWEEAAESMKDACEHIGLPRPKEVVLHPVSLVEGVPHARDFPKIERKNKGGKLAHRHAVLTFNEPVVGPVLIGAGRFRGYGICLPLDRRHTPVDV